MCITLDLGGLFSFCLQICIQEMFIDYQVNNNKHFRQENTSLLMNNCGHDKKTTKSVMYMAITLNLFEDVVLISVVHIQRHPVTMYDTIHIRRI